MGTLNGRQRAKIKIKKKSKKVRRMASQFVRFRSDNRSTTFTPSATPTVFPIVGRLLFKLQLINIYETNSLLFFFFSYCSTPLAAFILAGSVDIKVRILIVLTVFYIFLQSNFLIYLFDLWLDFVICVCDST